MLARDYFKQSLHISAETSFKKIYCGTSVNKIMQMDQLIKNSIQINNKDKRYYEFCFEDDGFESSDIDDTPPESLNQNEPMFKLYKSLEKIVIDPPDIIVKNLINNENCDDKEAEIVAALIKLNYNRDDALTMKNCKNLEEAVSKLQKECELCNKNCSMNNLIGLLKCNHECCTDCAKKFFTLQITEKSINDCNCPFCKQPELGDASANDNDTFEYFSNLDIFLKNILEPEVHELFQRKLRDRSLMQDPNFKWCVQCSSGFFARPKQKRLICPDCGSITCAQCRKTWEKQHDGISCEKYMQWLEDNNPDKQNQEVVRILETSGIDCPQCNYKFSLSSGGCVHLICSQCKHEFCYGCKKPFMKGAKCKVSSNCINLGLHAHHPRNCLFYLRDKEPYELENLLKQNNISFTKEPKEIYIDNCSIQVQMDAENGSKFDGVCNNSRYNEYTELCSKHYIEYLVKKIFESNIDPLSIFDLNDCMQELRRRGIALPSRGPWDTDPIYRDMCSTVIAQNIPLN